MKCQSFSLLIAKGMAMGAADAVPGISGGTIAFITGIYDRLLTALKRINFTALGQLCKEGPGAFWATIDGTFLACIFGGVLLSVMTLAHLISYLLTDYPVLLFAFFFGLILISGGHLLRQIRPWNSAAVLALVMGLIIAYGICQLPPQMLTPTRWVLLAAGAVAACAMILPGISGSLILVLLGLYGPVLNAVKTLDIVTLAIFTAGCVGGLLLFSHGLSWLLNKHRTIAMALLTGLMLGTLGKVWPWQQTLAAQVPVTQVSVSPFTYEYLTGQPAYFWQALSLMAAAVLLFAVLERCSRRA